MSEEINISENTIDGKGAECCCRTKVRSEKEQKDLINRLSRIEGQVRGIRRMLESHSHLCDGRRAGGQQRKGGRTGEDIAKADEIIKDWASCRPPNFGKLCGAKLPG